VCVLTKWTGSGVRLSLHWNVSLPRIIRYDDRAVSFVLSGDVESIKQHFLARQSTPYDVLKSGTSLLHVSFYSQVTMVSVNRTQLAVSRGHLDMVEFLLQNGANVNAMDDFGE
jgi:hypothetical protein